MRTSLNKLKLIDDYLLGNLHVPDALLFEANIILNTELADSVALQKQTHQLVKNYGRQSLKAELTAVQHQLSTAPEHRGFMQSIANIFKKH
ncbi:hypothetical protein [Mucilaginibacter auburnensis]|uniref:Uncharacterized protein n=1 Tax=Mucilaginibacter auburnensis TaxID=1457233 RepID=A0A2H9VP36_9SPHI|nr:hypothetical protein [Mucilaginibacter auburnensis]PJJ80072.1 hypothetical protein CLV57_3216 [Mucilaginibacter auburnensis]